MPRNAGVSIENNFSKGLITEASGLNFPENACTETFNCHFELTGEVRRREGFDFEINHEVDAIDKTGAAISSYLWKNVAGDGDVTLFVLQVGNKLHFYNVGAASLSFGHIASTLDLTSFDVTGSPSPATNECQYADGNGYLIVTHPNCESFFVEFDVANQTVSGTAITLQIRDFVGIEEAGVAVNSRSQTLSDAHKYNLKNQGWGASSYAATSDTDSITAGIGAKAFTVAGGPWTAGDNIFIWSKSTFQDRDADIMSWMQGDVASYSDPNLSVNVTSFRTDGAAHTDWHFASTTDHIQIFNQVMDRYPSNADVWWDFKNADDIFDPGKTAVHVNRGTTPAPKGHYILTVYDQQRDAVSGISGLTDVTTSFYRATTSAFYTGRVFYSGIPYAGYSGNIYFTQIIEPGTTDAIGKCFQKNDPTNELLFDLLPDDGGVIKIPEAGAIYKLWSMQGGLMVFATNGIWQITGSQGIGFTATDYTVRQLSTIKTISATSFVDVAGYPAWWTSEGIYIMRPNESLSGVLIESLTDATIFTFYNAIPLTSKRKARGYFNPVTKKVQWLYRSTVAGTIDEAYEFDRVLNFDVLTGALYPWTISESDVKIHAVVVPESFGGSVTEDQVTSNSGADTVQDASGNNVVVYSISDNIVAIPVFKYVGSYDDSGDQFTILEENGETYLDFFSYDDVGEDYESYFITGYKVHGQGQRKFQSNYVYIFSNEIPSQYEFRGIWNYANSSGTHEWSNNQTVTLTDTRFDIVKNRLKVRGEGLALQFRVGSITGQPFSIVGWSVWETGNASP